MTSFIKDWKDLISSIPTIGSDVGGNAPTVKIEDPSSSFGGNIPSVKIEDSTKPVIINIKEEEENEGDVVEIVKATGFKVKTEEIPEDISVKIEQNTIPITAIDLTEEEIGYKPHKAPGEEKENPALKQERLEALLTHGRKNRKPILDTHGTDLYTTTSTPSNNILYHFDEFPMTDELGRRYWLVKDLEEAFDWTRTESIRRSNSFNRSTDLIFFVRPAEHRRVDGDLEIELPNINCITEQSFIVKIQGDNKKILPLLGTVVDSGVDELSDKRSKYKSRRATSWVVIRNLHIKK